MIRYQRLSGLLLIFVFISCLTALAKQVPQVGLEPGKILPAFKLPNLNGTEIPLLKLRGRIVIIHLWKGQ